jgi:hypothetical protein
MRLEVRHAKAHRGNGVVCLLNGARCHAQGHGDTIEQAHAALVAEARELHAALGPWLGEQTHVNPERDPFYDEYAHEVDVSTRMRFNGGKPFAQVVATLEDTGVSEGVCGMGATREAALESLRAALVVRQASEWAAFARALKGGE